MFVSSDFKKFCNHLDLESLDHSLDVVYLVDRNLIIKGYNDAYLQFAHRNDGKVIVKNFLEGASLCETCSEPLKSFWMNSYKRAIEKNVIFEHEFLCPSPTQQRLYRQTAYPILHQSGLVISNHLVESYELKRAESDAFLSFENEYGFIVQCQNCRKIRNPKNKNQWIWVPSLVEKMAPNTSHSICPCCLDHFFPDISAG